jgi:tetratricopeptide (TPR) repeat protein
VCHRAGNVETLVATTLQEVKKSRVLNKPAAAAGADSRRHWIYAFLFIIALAAYAPAAHFDFLNYDDPFYVSQNVHVRQGLTPDTIKWAFTSGEGANWFPVTRLSELVDVQLFGLDPGWHHLTNVFLHALSTLLLFAFLFRATRAHWPSALAAVIFALHPLHVESVAWISERKDVLSAFFWMLSLWAYVRYVERPERGRYLLALVAFALGLMSKPMIVSLPFLLLLLDLWPLRRKPALLEKLPFLALSVAVAIATYLVQQASGAVRTFTAYPLALRVENALVSYVGYIAKTFWPSGLAVFYPYPLDIPIWQPLLAAAVIAGGSVWAVREFRACPYLAVGWFWYLITIAPVIGIVQVGGQARADRYMYVPMIGLTIMLAWGAVDLLGWRPQWKQAIIVSAGVAAIACFILTWQQNDYWRNSETLFQHAIDVTDHNDVAQHNLGNVLLDIPGRLPDAVAHLQEAILINPQSPGAHVDLGTALSKSPSRLADAVAEFQAAVRIDPNLPIPHINLGMALSQIPGRQAEALAEAETAVRLDPDSAAAHNALGIALADAGRMPEAVEQFSAALRLRPDYTEARTNLERAKADQQQKPAEKEYDLALSLAKTPGKLPEAITHFETALRLDPNNAEAHNNLGFALTNFPQRLPEAIAQFEAALRINPNYADAHYNLGVALSNLPGRMPEAIRHLEAAERLKPDPELEQLLKRLKN